MQVGISPCQQRSTAHFECSSFIYFADYDFCNLNLPLYLSDSILTYPLQSHLSRGVQATTHNGESPHDRDRLKG
jgi:hypothetical protein